MSRGHVHLELDILVLLVRLHLDLLLKLNHRLKLGVVLALGGALCVSEAQRTPVSVVGFVSWSAIVQKMEVGGRQRCGHMTQHVSRVERPRACGAAVGATCLDAMWIAWLLLLPCVLAHTIDLLPHTEHCFFEDMHVGDEMTLTYQVSGGGHLDIDVRIRDPDGQLLFQQLRKDTGTYDFIADADGRYTYCFSNEFSTISDKTLRYVTNAHAVSTCTAFCTSLRKRD